MCEAIKLLVFWWRQNRKTCVGACVGDKISKMEKIFSVLNWLKLIEERKFYARSQIFLCFCVKTASRAQTQRHLSIRVSFSLSMGNWMEIWLRCDKEKWKLTRFRWDDWRQRRHERIFIHEFGDFSQSESHCTIIFNTFLHRRCWMIQSRVSTEGTSHITNGNICDLLSSLQFFFLIDV